MKKRLLWFLPIFVLLFAQCSRDGFNNDEYKLIKGASEQTVFRLFTINNSSDSLFLRQPARAINVRHIQSKAMQYFKSRLLVTVTDSINDGVGIAAPQVGVGLKIIYIQRFDKEGKPFEIYYNPVIEHLGDSINSGLEGCLSVPGYRATVDRSQNIIVTYLDSVGIEQREEIRDFTAVIFQHEIDHLNGMLFFDHVNNGFPTLDEVHGF